MLVLFLVIASPVWYMWWIHYRAGDFWVWISLLLMFVFISGSSDCKECNRCLILIINKQHVNLCRPLVCLLWNSWILEISFNFAGASNMKLGCHSSVISPLFRDMLLCVIWFCRGTWAVIPTCMVCMLESYFDHIDKGTKTKTKISLKRRRLL